MRPITFNEIKPLQKPIQHFSDCYLVSSIGSLARSEEGRKILSKNIAHQKDNFRVRFQNIDNRKRDFFITEEEINNLVLLDKYYNEIIPQTKQNPILKAIELSMGKIIEQNPLKKPFICRLRSCQEKFEKNFPSNFLEMFTGKKPITLNEKTIRMNLAQDKEEAIDLFQRIGESKDFNFVAGTGIFSKEGLTSEHCYILERVDYDNKLVQLFDCRKQESVFLPFRRAINGLKYLTGYLNA